MATDLAALRSQIEDLGLQWHAGVTTNSSHSELQARSRASLGGWIDPLVVGQNASVAISREQVAAMPAPAMSALPCAAMPAPGMAAGSDGPDSSQETMPSPSMGAPAPGGEGAMPMPTTYVAPAMPRPQTPVAPAPQEREQVGKWVGDGAFSSHR